MKKDKYVSRWELFMAMLLLLSFYVVTYFFPTFMNSAVNVKGIKYILFTTLISTILVTTNIFVLLGISPELQKRGKCRLSTIITRWSILLTSVCVPVFIAMFFISLLIIQMQGDVTVTELRWFTLGDMYRIITLLVTTALFVTKLREQKVEEEV